MTANSSTMGDRRSNYFSREVGFFHCRSFWAWQVGVAYLEAITGHVRLVAMQPVRIGNDLVSSSTDIPRRVETSTSPLQKQSVRTTET
jgi:hypothetical protein